MPNCSRRIFAGLALAAIAAAPALAQSTLEEAKANGYIRVGFATRRRSASRPRRAS